MVQRTWGLEGFYCGTLEVLKAKRRIRQPWWEDRSGLCQLPTTAWQAQEAIKKGTGSSDPPLTFERSCLLGLNNLNPQGLLIEGQLTDQGRVSQWGWLRWDGSAAALWLLRDETLWHMASWYKQGWDKQMRSFKMERLKAGSRAISWPKEERPTG